jgi:hypothetical protein
MYLEIHMWSPASIPTLGPTWYSHCTGKVYELWRSTLSNNLIYFSLRKMKGETFRENLWVTCLYSMEVLLTYLTRHDLPICSTNVNSSIKACLVVSIWYVTAKRFVCSYSAVVWTLQYFDTIFVLKQVCKKANKRCMFQSGLIIVWLTKLFFLVYYNTWGPG